MAFNIDYYGNTSGSWLQSNNRGIHHLNHAVASYSKIEVVVELLGKPALALPANQLPRSRHVGSMVSLRFVAALCYRVNRLLIEHPAKSKMTVPCGSTTLEPTLLGGEMVSCAIGNNYKGSMHASDGNIAPLL